MKILICGRNYRKIGYLASDTLFKNKELIVSVSNDIKQTSKLLATRAYDRIVLVDAPEWKEKIEFEKQKIIEVQTDRLNMNGLDRLLVEFITGHGVKKWYLFLLQYVILFLLAILDVMGQKTVICELFVSRIGHLGYNTYVAVSKKLQNEYRHIIGIYDGFVASPTILNMFRKHFLILSNHATFYKIMTLPAILNSKYYIDGHYLLEAIYPHYTLPRIELDFSKEQEQDGEKFLRSLGIDADEWFVCVANRDEQYLNTVVPNADWSYHRFRNCDINNFKEAIDYIVAKGGHVVRIGVHPKEKLESTAMIHDISDADDFYQIYCMARCRFYLGVYTGLGVVAFLFGRPQCSVNLSQPELLTIFDEKDIILPKHFWHNNTGRYLEIEEVIKLGHGRNTRADQFFGIDIEENTEKEIYLACKEMLEGSNELTERQRQFINFLSTADYISKGINVRLAECYNSVPIQT